MTTLKNLPVDDLNMLLHVVQESFSVRQNYQLFSWLQQDVQQFVPHDILITAWGDFRSGQIRYEIISPCPVCEPTILTTRRSSLSWPHFLPAGTNVDVRPMLSGQQTVFQKPNSTIR